MEVVHWRQLSCYNELDQRRGIGGSLSTHIRGRCKAVRSITSKPVHPLVTDVGFARGRLANLRLVAGDDKAVVLLGTGRGGLCSPTTRGTGLSGADAL